MIARQKYFPVAPTRLSRLDERFWPAPEATGWVRHIYVLQEEDAGPVKVGLAANAFWRRGDLQSGNPRRLHLRAVYEVDRRNAAEFERAALEHFRDRSISGEWLDAPWHEVAQFLDLHLGKVRP